jgi:hypothetical protein
MRMTTRSASADWDGLAIDWVLGAGVELPARTSLAAASMAAISSRVRGSMLSVLGPFASGSRLIN